MSYNIRYGGTDREEAIASVIRASHPDIVILQEATRPEVVNKLASLTGLAHWGAKRGRSLAFLSALPVSTQSWRRPFWSRHAFLELVPTGLDVRIFGVHLSAVHAAWTERRRILELKSLLTIIRAEAHGFHVVTGDFNTLAPGELLDVQRLPRRLRPLVWMSGGRIRWRTIATMLEAGYLDGWRLLHSDVPSMPTFPTWDRHVRLDFLFVPTPFAERLTQCDVVRQPSEVRSASDHLPLFVTLTAEANVGGARVERQPRESQ